MTRSRDEMLQALSDRFQIGQYSDAEMSKLVAEARQAAAGAQAAAAGVPAAAPQEVQDDAADAPAATPQDGRDDDGERFGTRPPRIAIVGIAGFFPGVGSAEAFCAALGEQRSLLEPMPPDHGSDRPDEDRIGAFVPNIAGFDPTPFGFNLREAEYADPRLRLLLMASWHTFEDACIVPEDLAQRPVAVYIASEESAYLQFVSQSEISPYTPLSSSWALPNRISAALGLTGESVLVNTACSGASVAMHHAIRSLRSGESDFALVGAANLLYGRAASVTYHGQRKLGILSATDECRPFQGNADGFVPAEGVVTVLLRRLDDAVADGNRIYGVLLGSHVNHVGGRAMMTSPNAAAQADAIVGAYRDAAIDPGSVTYIEAQGSSTLFGDAEEFNAFIEADRRLLGAHAAAALPCKVSTLKPNIGHANSASGLLALARVLDAFRRERKLGIKNFGTLSPLINLAGQRFSIDADTESWPASAQAPRRAAINNFGAGGVNAHLLLEQYDAPAAPAEVGSAPYYLAFSACEPETLVRIAENFAAFLDSDTSVSPGQLETLLITGRKALRERIVFQGNDRKDLRARLQKFVESNGGRGYLVRGSAKTASPVGTLFRRNAQLTAFLDGLSGEGDKRLLFELWVDGHEQPARRFFAARRCAKQSLPRYPFRLQPIWLQSSEGAAPAHERGGALHPLVHENVSGVGGLLFKSAFNGGDICVAAEAISGRCALSAAVLLEIGVVACALAQHGQTAQWPLRVEQVRFGELPLWNSADGAAEFDIGVFAAEAGALGFELASASGEWRAEGVVQTGAAAAVATASGLAALRATLAPLDAARSSGRVLPAGLGPLQSAPGVLLAPLSSAGEAWQRRIAVLDAALALLPLLRDDVAADCRAVAIERIDWLAELPPTCWIAIRHEADAGVADVSICSDDDSVLAQIAGLAWTGTAAAPQPAAVDADTSSPAPAADASLLQRLGEELRALAAGVLKLPAESIDPAAPLADSGFDSISFGLLADHLGRRFDLTIAPTVFFGHSSVAQLTTHFAHRHAKAVARAFGQAAARARAPAAATLMAAAEPRQRRARGLPEIGAQAAAGAIAIIGISGRFPQARSVDAMWQILASGTHAVAPIPRERVAWWSDDAQAVPPYAWSGCIDGVDEFDALFFEVSPKEARGMDPRQRLLLQESWNALEDAGYGETQLRAGTVGMFVGVEPGNYLDLTGKVDSVTDSSDSVLAARLSYFLDLSGPNMAINTACSSGLVAAHQACVALRQQECDTALAAAVNLLLSPGPYVGMLAAGMLSPDGRCHTFDRRANGMVPGEAIVVFVLKRLADAERDNDPIHALIRGSGINYDGKTNGITAPSSVSQARLLKDVYRRFDVDPAAIDYVVAHGTGTQLGDPVEIEALHEVFAGRSDRCVLTSTKTNFGHSFAASGLVSLACLVQALRHERIPQSLHCEHESTHVDWAASPFVVAKQSRPWPAVPGRRRRGAVSAFGVSGTNAHMVVEEYPAAGGAAAATGSVLLALSAKNPAALQRRAQALQAFLRGVPDEQLTAISATLLCGRHHFRHRCAFVASSADTAVQTLQTYIDAGTAPTLQRGQVERGFAGNAAAAEQGETLLRRCSGGGGDALRRDDDLAALAALFCAGHELPWALLFGEAPPRRLHLPGYPFARERHWLLAERAAAPAAGMPAQLHPLLHENVSQLTGLAFRSRFDGEEFFFADHVIQTQRVLPGVAYLEMVREAVARALPDATGIALSQVVWLRPLQADGAVETVLTLRPHDSGSLRFEIARHGADGRSLLCQGLAAASGASLAPLALARLHGDSRPCPVTPAEFYALFAAMDMHYGPGQQSVRSVRLAADGVLAELELPAGIAQAGYGLHPSLLDGALQASIALNWRGETAAGGGALVPFALESLQSHGRCAARMWAWIRYRGGAAAASGPLDVDLCDESGSVAAALRGFSARAFSGDKPSTDAATLLLQPHWHGIEGAAAVPGMQRQVWLLDGDAALAAQLQQRLACACIALAPIAGDPATRFRAQAAQLFERLQTLAAAMPAPALRIQVVASAADALPGIAALLRSVAAERPALAGQVLQVDGDRDPAGLAELLDRAAASGAGECRRRDGELQARHWQALAAATAAQPWRDGGVYLITGGAGALGRIFAAEIQRRTRQATVVLVGRSAPDAALQARIDALRAGATIDYRQVDLADAAAVRELIAAIRRQYGGLHGILHAAGVIRDNYLGKKTRAELDAVLAPKVDGAVLLDAASCDCALDLFVLFSSLAGALGNPGQLDYAAGNGFLDDFAAARNRRVRAGEGRGRSVSINWPLWQGEGMTVAPAVAQMMRDSIGLLPMPAAAGLDAFYAAWASAADQVLVMHGQPARMSAVLSGQAAAPAPAIASADAPAAGSAAGETDWLALLQDEVSRQLELRSDDIDPDAELSELGYDSISLTELANRLNERLKTGLMPTVFFEHPTLAAFARHLQNIAPAAAATPLPQAPAPAAAAAFVAAPAAASAFVAAPDLDAAFVPGSASASAARDSRAAIAVVGMSGRFPLADDLDAFWRNLRDERDCIVEIPASRWDWREHYGDPRREPNKTNVKWGSFIDGVDEFDPLFFGISGHEAVLMDPQQRLLLMHAWAAIEDAGYAPRDLAGSRTGVFVGTALTGYHSLFDLADTALEGYSSTGSVPSVGPNRLSFFLDIHGPSEPIETACSSSLVAIHRAVMAIREESCSAALAGGVNTMVTPAAHISFSQAGMLSEDGRCKTFSDRADGYVRGEGVGILLLKRQADAEAAGDHIYGLIRASAENHGGRANSLTAPNPKAQAALLEAVYGDAGIDPRSVSYIEAHGTGTELGDPVEVNALKTAFANLYARAGAAAPAEPHCGLGTVKSNIGHLELSSGIAGVIKVLLQLKHAWLVKSLHCEQLNPYIDLAGSPFYVVRESRPWPAATGADGSALPRRAGVSSFGFGGANAHIVVEEYRDRRGSGLGQGSGVAILLSARDEAGLRGQVQRLRAALSDYAPTDLGDLAYTLQVGRDAMSHRLAMLTASLDELRVQLDAVLAGQAVAGLRQGVVRRTPRTPSAQRVAAPAWPASRDALAQILDQWVQGRAVDWAAAYAGHRPRRLALPTYAFARERYWAPPPRRAATQAVQALLHPLLHRNSSTLDGQRFSSRFDRADPLLRDGVLPAAALLPMLCAALRESTAAAPGWRLQEVRWGAPARAGSEIHVGVAPASGRLALELYSDGEHGREVHGQAYGEARPFAPARLDLAAIAAGLTEVSPQHWHGDGQWLYGADRAGDELGWLQQATALAGGEAVSLQRLDTPGDWRDARWLWLRRRAGGGFDATLCADDGNVLASLTGWTLAPLPGSTTAAAAVAPAPTLTPNTEPASEAAELLLEPVWRSAPTPARNAALAATRWLVSVGADAALHQQWAAQLPAAAQSLRCGDIDGAAGFCRVAGELFALVKQVLSARPDGDVLVQVLVCGDGQGSAYGAGLAALLKTAQQENPLLRGQVIVVPAGFAPAQGSPLDVDAADAAVEIRYRDGHRQVRELRQAAAAAAPAPAWKEGGVYLITGGAGGLGLLLAQALTARLRRVRLVLTGRSALDPARAQQLDGLRRDGVQIDYRAVAVDDAHGMQALFDDLRAGGRVDGIVHAAGVIRDNYILRKSAEDVAAVLAPKALGVELLDRLSRDLAPDFLLLFSSLAGAYGNAGQADYAAGNGYLDGFAAWRAERAVRGECSGRSLALNWPLWRDGGMHVDAATQSLVAQQFGLQPLETEAGLRCLDTALAAAQTQVIVLSGDVSKLRQTFLPAAAAASSAAPAAAANAPALEDIEHKLRVLFARAVKIDVARVRTDEPFETYGFDSLMVTRLTVKLTAIFGELSKTLLYEYQTLRELAGYFATQHAAASAIWCGGQAVRARPTAAGAATAVVAASAPPPPTPLPAQAGPLRSLLAADSGRGHAEPIAIIGVTGRYPQAEDLDQLWSNLAAGKDCIREIPAERWPVDAFFDADRDGAIARLRYYCKWGGFLDGFADFDCAFFKITPAEALDMDPQARLFIESCWGTLEDAGYTHERLQRQHRRRVGVFAGITTTGFELYGPQLWARGQEGHPRTSFASVANRISYLLDLAGPSMPVDTMCSSSLTAIHEACEHLRRGECELALAGGVNLYLHPSSYIDLCAHNMLSSDGRCKSFGDGGDGFVPGEGVGTVLLKPLAAAERDRDPIRAVIRGSAINHGGKTNGYTVPSPIAQGELIREALRKAGVDARWVSYVEAHGTGTELGDPIEIRGLSHAFAADTHERGFCAIGSIKSNIGHLEAAAGIAGLSKILLQLQHGQLAPSLHAARLNPNIDFASTPFVVQRELARWERPQLACNGSTRQIPRIAGLSSFGAGGANAHVIVEEYMRDVL